MTAPARHDVVGVGLGPFNLGLAALLDPVGDVDAVFLDARPEFSWHPGLMLPDAEVQVPFLADLVTLADPTSRHGVLQYLHEQGRLYRFYFLERMHLLRAEFDDYCRWVAGRLPSCRFGHRVDAVEPLPGGDWAVRATGPEGPVELRAGAVVMGVGSVPALPDCAPAGAAGVLHSADYLRERERLLTLPSVAVIGAGQSAAEVVADLLDNGVPGARRVWMARGEGFLPMEYSKLGLEHFSPEYTAHFHGLPPERRDDLRSGQDLLYKGISADTSARIYDALYRATVAGGDPGLEYRARCELTALEPDGDAWTLRMRHLDDGGTFDVRADAVVLGTGYRDAPWPAGLEEALVRDAQGRPAVDAGYRVARDDGAPSTLFVQNAELHTHGVGAPDLGLGAHRNAVIVNALCGREVYPVRERNVFQSFGSPS
ncbi:MAG: lysine N(6)-hydroxylase/L-ornithine N(5)-oxygenase family protein [Thermoleophilia bacterium]